MDRRDLRSTGLAVATLAAGALCVYVASPLLAPILWALVFALVARPLHGWIERRLKRPSIAAGVVVAMIGIGVALPLAFVASQLLQEAADVVERVRGGEAARLWNDTLARQPTLAALAEWIGRRADLGRWLEQGAAWASRLLQRLLAGSIAGATGALIMLFLLFFMLRDRARMLAAVDRFLPLTARERIELFAVVDDTVHATFWGTLAMGLAQGTLGALVFWWLGLPAPALWAAVMAVLSILPVLGAALVWLPAAAWLALQDRWADALTLAAFGAIVIGLIDNLIYPLVVKNRLRLHAVPVFVSIIGGLIVFGASGVILGPLLLAVTDALVTFWRRRLLAHDGGDPEHENARPPSGRPD